MMETTTVFEDGRSQTIRLPNKIHLKSTEVVVKQLGDAVLIVPKDSLWQTFEEGVRECPDDFFAEGRDQGILEERDWS